MASMFRSEEMTLCQLFLQSESAYACVSELGELGLVEFRDLNPDVNAFQRKFVNEVRRCDEMERKLRFMQKEIDKAGIPIADTGENPEAPHPREMIDLEAQFEQLENEMKDSNANFEALQRSFLELTELKHILRKTQGFFEEAELHVQQQYGDSVAQSEEAVSLLGENELALAAAGRLGKAILRPRPGSLKSLVVLRPNSDQHPMGTLGMFKTILAVIFAHEPFVAGVIERTRCPTFERLLWRACRGNVFFKQAEIESSLEDPGSRDPVHKCVFIIFFQGDQLKTRVKKICEGFKATLYPCPETPAERREMAIGVMTRIEDLQTVLHQTQDHRHRLLMTIAKNINVWFIKVKKIKAIYHTMNMFNLDVTQKCLIAECWCPVSELEKIQLALRRGTERSAASVPSILNRMHTKREPPTFHRTNKFTEGFQAIVDSYGVANYQEVNPALFTIITFPFLFSVMFGDCGHGLIMALFGLWLILNEKKLANVKTGGEMFSTIYGGRYLVFLMGVFSIHSGLLYNDCFSKSLNIFGTAWNQLSPNNTNYNLKHLEHLSGKKGSNYITLDPRDSMRTIPYYFGIDPVWQAAVNKLSFLNSYKMKLSVIFGVTHMLFGVVLSLYNHRHFKEPLNIWCEFLPQMLFMGCIFGYLVILIFYKWLAFSLLHSKKFPSLLLALIGMFLNFGKKIEEDSELYSGQRYVQVLLVVVAVMCVPWMLLTKPIILYVRHRQKMPGRKFQTLDEEGTPYAVNSMDDRANMLDNQDVTHYDDFHGAEEHEEAEEFEAGEVFVHQAIHTIEYCLGCISNTASYLRLWALSLAHAQLSEVLWNMVFKMSFKMTGFVGAVAIFALFGAWAALTIAILLVMEGLSAFLHTLRLHWVEFQGKFYTGQGHKFAPFSFKAILADDFPV